MKASSGTTRAIGFVLTPGYALMSLAAAVESLRGANDLAEKGLYAWKFYSMDGGFMASTSGGGFSTVSLQSLIDADDAEVDLVFVVAGGNPMLYEDRGLERCLRSLQQRRVSLGGISGGAAILAKAGMLSGRRFTVHWAHIDPLLEHDPDLLIERALYVIDRDRYTCAGGVAAMDMMGAMIAREHGAGFARDVSEWFIYPRLRTAEEPQLSDVGRRFNLHQPLLVSAVELMSSHLADPLTADQISALTGSSKRQLQRLFVDHFSKPMMGMYRDLRLNKANEMLRQTALPVLEVAIMTGFASTAHFSRCFSARYGHPPRAVRRRTRD